MKIGLVCPYNITKGGGVQEVVKALQTELNARGHQAVIVTPKPREQFEYKGDRAMAFLGTAADFRSPLATTAQFSASVVTDEIDTLLDYEQFDVLHFHEPWVPMLNRQILSRSSAANVATFHAKLPDTAMSRTMAKVVTPYTKPLLKYIDEFTAVSDAAAGWIRSLTDAPVHIIPNGINLPEYKFKAQRTPAGKPKTIFYIGRLERRKGVKYLLRAMQVLQQKAPDVRLVLAGDGPDREKLEALTAELSLQHVTFLGYVDDAKKQELFHNADLFCSPAIFGESFGIVLLEAMACGLVTVAGNNPGYASVMQGVGNISLVDPKDTPAFAERLHMLLFTDDLRKVWQSWAKKYIQQFDYPKVVDGYEAAYQRAIKRHAEK